MSGSALLSLRNVCMRHRENGVITHALRDVSFTVHRGEFVSIVGPSGAGKSTLLNILGLLESPTSGQYEVDGVEVGALRERERDALRARTFGFVFQSSHALPEESVARNAALALDTQNMPRPKQVEVVERVLRALGLLHTANRKAKFLSGGERQRLAIGRAISTDPLVVLADEPTGNLDRENSARVLSILSELNRSGVTILLITHDESVARVARRTVRIVDGRLVDDERIERTTETPSSSSEIAQSPAAPSRLPRASMASILADALSSITSHAARSAFLILAFLLGAGGLVSAVGLSQSAATQVSGRLSEEALDRLTVRLPPDWSSDQRAEAKDRILDIPGVRAAADRVLITSSAAHVTLVVPGSFPNQPVFEGLVIGGGSKLLDLEGLSVVPAQASSLLDGEEPVAILGQSAAAALGVGAIEPGVQIWVNGTRVPVVGLFSGSDVGRDYANTVLLALPFATSGVMGDQTLVVRTAVGYPAPVADALPLVLAPAEPASVTIETVADLRNLARGVNADFAVFIAAMSLAILILASFSAATTMYLSVMGRSSEIALRRAVGASRRRIGLMYLAEGFLLGLAGGSAGCAAGSAAVVVFCLLNGWSPALSWVTVGLALTTGLGTGLLSAIVPAVRAARVDPAQAIRA